MAPWKANRDLMQRLTAAQNSPRFALVDILTFAGMCSDRAELERHVVSCETQAAKRERRVA